MKFYKENEINPLGSCLPLVAQIPVFISLFYMLRQDLRKNICPADPGRVPGQVRGGAPHHAGPGRRPHDAVRPQQRRRLPVHPGPDEQGHRRGADRPADPLRRDAARLEPDDVEPDDGQAAAEPDAAPAAGVRGDRDQLPRGPDRLLDHDQHLDDGPAVHRAKIDRDSDPGGRYGRRRATGRRGGGGGGRGGSAATRAAAVRHPRTTRVRTDPADRRRRRAVRTDSRPSQARARARCRRRSRSGKGGTPPPPPRKKKKRSGRRR